MKMFQWYFWFDIHRNMYEDWKWIHRGLSVTQSSSKNIFLMSHPWETIFLCFFSNLPHFSSPKSHYGENYEVMCTYRYPCTSKFEHIFSSTGLTLSFSWQQTISLSGHTAFSPKSSSIPLRSNPSILWPIPLFTKQVSLATQLKLDRKKYFKYISEALLEISLRGVRTLGITHKGVKMSII